MSKKLVQVPSRDGVQHVCKAFATMLAERGVTYDEYHDEKREEMTAKEKNTIIDLTKLSSCALLIITHFMYRDTQPDRDLIIGALGELGRRGFACNGWTMSNDIADIDDDTRQRLADYYCEFDLQHEFFEDVLEVGDPHTQYAAEYGC